MQQTSADLLEFEALRTLIGRYIGSPMGKFRLADVEPSTDREPLEAAFADLREAIDYLKTAAKPQSSGHGNAVRLRFGGLPDARAAVAKIRIEGAVLDGLEIFEITALLDRAADIRSNLLAAEQFPRLHALGATIGEFRTLLEDLSGKILPDGSLADHASVALNRIRRGIEKQKRDIQESLERFLRAHRGDGTLQEDFVTLRNDRFVVPIAVGQHRKVDGVVHGTSGSGQTLFIEPLETIGLNNDLVRLTEEELREVHRVLKDWSERLRRHAEPIRLTIDLLGRLDLLFAKAQFALDFECTLPVFSPPEAPRLHLEMARHPLLEDILRRQRKPIIPISLTLERSTRTLLLSGPNTGGKTVSLKTAGLLTLMAQSALPIPCVAAEFPLFDQVLADVGDNQSIQESLSSFSAHIRRVGELLDAVTPDSLVLLDELGRATDPEEGGALGVAVVDEFRTVGAFTLASTHLSALKIYGGNTAGVLNGSMGFDKNTLEPTYRLRLGAPGESAGLDIASRLGLSPSLITKARGLMTSSARAMADFLEQLQQKIEAAARKEEELEAQRKALAAREQAVAKEWAQRESAKLKELEERTEALIARFEEQARATIDAITEGAQNRKASEKALRQVSRTMREFREGVSGVVSAPKSGAPPRPKIEEGVRVRLKDVREPARVRRRLGDDRIEVQAGFLKLQVPIEDVLEILPETDPAGAAALPKNVSFQSAGPRWDVSYREINLIGKRAEEAEEEIDKFLDQAVMGEINRVRIVHGHGMGILKRLVNEKLAKSPHVEKFYPASPAEGGTGATVVELKEN